jgi:CBS domain-containing protein
VHQEKAAENQSSSEIKRKPFIMRVSAFMVPADKVIKCTEWDAVQACLKLILEHKISAVLVMGKDGKPTGIVTKTDLVAAYSNGISLHHNVGLVMAKKLDTVLDTDTRDSAAGLFERNGHHHALVFNKEDQFVGLISAWDIVTECAKDGRAWPWLRPEDGRIQAH